MPDNHEEYQDLIDKYRDCNTPQEFLEMLWENSNKNSAAYNYMAGAIDALRFAEKLSKEEYSDAVDKYIFNYKG